MEIVIFHRMVKYGAQLVVQRLKVYRGISLPVLVPGIDHLILPGDHVLRLDLADLPASEIRQDLRPENVFFGVPGVFLESAFHILGIALYEAGEGHIQIRFLLIELLPFPG